MSTEKRKITNTVLRYLYLHLPVEFKEVDSVKDIITSQCIKYGGFFLWLDNTRSHISDDLLVFNGS